MAENTESSTLDLTQTIDIAAPPETVWQNLIQRLSVSNSGPDNSPMPMVLEQKPGGRWYRDLGENQGHLWGFVQVIKAPYLLEINGPLFMSYAVTGHIQLRVAATENGSTFTLRHRAVGMIEDDHRQGIVPGWDWLLQNVKALSE
jgi:hypothetical protein